MSRRSVVARYLSQSGLLGSLGRLRSACGRTLPVLAYHRVWDVADEAAFPFDIELVSASTIDFAWQMEYVRENFNPITCEDLVRILSGERDAPERPLIVTFDDGFADNHALAFPILQALGIPATFFISTGYLDAGHTFWFDRLAHLVLTTRRDTITVPGWRSPVSLASTAPERKAVLKSLLDRLKLVPDHERREALDAIEAQLGDEPRAPSFASEVLTWNQVREMVAGGMEFGSHTVTHPILANQTDDEVWRELTVSKQRIEAETGRRVRTLSYPVGGRDAFGHRVRQLTAEAGYDLGFSYISGTNHLGELDCWALKRLHVERYTDRAYFAAMLQLPELFQ